MSDDVNEPGAFIADRKAWFEDKMDPQVREAWKAVSRQEAERQRLAEEQPTLRDRFAMAALTGLIMCANIFIPPQENRAAKLSAEAYRLADGMLEARKPTS